MNRYETLEVSLQTDNKNQSRLSQTVDYGDDHQMTDNGESDDRVRKFRELYYRNQKLRRQLKILNSRLNQRLEKVKFPNVKRRAASVDLNHNPPSKAIQRELQNAYKQVNMYKKQVELLKVKEETPQNYGRLRDMENLIAFRDKEVSEVQEQLISIKNVKKMQEKKISFELENQQIIERLDQYQSEHKELKEKLKQIARKSRKREEEYKKQQAYLVSLEKKVRAVNNDEKKVDEEKIEVEPKLSREVSDYQFKEIKQMIAEQKKVNDEVLKKIQVHKRLIKQIKSENAVGLEKIKQKEALAKNLQMKILSLNRLLREDEKKEKTPPKNKLITKVEDIVLKDNLNDSFSQMENSQGPALSKQDTELKRMLNEMEGGEREWKGKFRKVEHGFGSPSDKKFQFQGILVGLKLCLDENEIVCGIICIFEGQNGVNRQEKVQGVRSNVELQWIAGPGDSISKISGSFTEQSYLSEVIITSRKGKSGIFGVSSTDAFTFRLSENERISGCFGSVKQLGIDRRITQLGFWIEKSE